MSIAWTIIWNWKKYSLFILFLLVKLFLGNKLLFFYSKFAYADTFKPFFIVQDISLGSTKLSNFFWNIGQSY